MEYVIFGVSLVAVIIVAKILSWPLKKILKLVINVIFGIILILIINTFGASIGLHIPFNFITAIVAGLLRTSWSNWTYCIKLYFLIHVYCIYIFLLQKIITLWRNYGKLQC